jgi:hypothetical protein
MDHSGAIALILPFANMSTRKTKPRPSDTLRKGELVGRRGMGGSRLKRVRVKRGLTYRDAEQLSRVLAARHRDDRFVVRISVLADIENHGSIPNMFHLHSLCVMYSLELKSVLSWYGVRTKR